MGKPILVISLADFQNRKHEIGKEVVEACKGTGLFLIKDHGIEEKVVAEAFEKAKGALALPDDIKKKYAFTLDQYVGWRSLDELQSMTGNRLWEQWLVNRHGLGGYNTKQHKFVGDIWPAELGEEYRDFTIRFQERTHQVLLKILQALALGLGWEESFFDEAFDISSPDNFNQLGLNYYPPMMEEELQEKQPPRLYPHTDMVAMTILYQKPGDTGLEIATGSAADETACMSSDPETARAGAPQAHEWTTLDCVKGCLTVNVGDGLARWTDGLLKSPYHRVRAPKITDNKGPRYSIPYFAYPKLGTVMQGPKKRFEPVTSMDLMAETDKFYNARKDKPASQQLDNDAIRDTRQPAELVVA